MAIASDGWLRRSGHPTLVYSIEYVKGEKKVVVKMEQTGWQDKEDEEERYPWDFPVSWAVVKDGRWVTDSLPLCLSLSLSLCVCVCP